MRVVVAIDGFKGSLLPREAADAVVAGVMSAQPDAQVVTVPLSDGGEGFVEAFLAAGFAEVPAACSGPTGEPVVTRWAHRDGVAVVELADACGLGRLPGGVLAGMDASSEGLGEVLAAVLDAGIREIVVGIGGSASTDGVAGMITALGARLLDLGGEPVRPGLRGLADLWSLEVSDVRQDIAEADITIASDVTNPLLGASGAAAVFGPQKGLTSDDIAAADARLAHLADLVEAFEVYRDVRGAGAAGGVGWALLALGGVMRPGVEVALELGGFDAVVAGADLVITGEGRLDAQSLQGKAPIGVARAARRAGVPVVAICGRTTLDAATLASAGFSRVIALTELEPDPDACMARASELVEQAAAALLV